MSPDLVGLNFTVVYAEPTGNFRGNDDFVDCTFVDAFQTAALFDAAGVFHVAVSTDTPSNGFRGPLELGECEFFYTDAPPSADDFVIQVRASQTADYPFAPADPKPEIRIAGIDCP